MYNNDICTEICFFVSNNYFNDRIFCDTNDGKIYLYMKL